MALDVAVAVVAVAFSMEKREEWGLLPLIAAQRFGYRQLLYYVVVKSLFSATGGTRVSHLIGAYVTRWSKIPYLTASNCFNVLDV